MLLLPVKILSNRDNFGNITFLDPQYHFWLWIMHQMKAIENPNQKRITLLPKSKNQGRKYQKLTCKCLLHVCEVALWMVTMAKCLRSNLDVFIKGTCTLQRHSLVLCVEINQGLKEISSFVSKLDFRCYIMRGGKLCVFIVWIPHY